jgi:hypothetical protein
MFLIPQGPVKYKYKPISNWVSHKIKNNKFAFCVLFSKAALARQAVHIL